MNTTRETFDKAERLCSTKVISGLFESGNIFYSSLFKVVWGRSPVSLPCPAQVTFSVSKRGFRLAVTRNLIKRRMREAYRKNKRTLYEHLSSENIQIAFVVILKGNAVPDYLAIEKSMKDMINKLIILTSPKSEARSPKSED
ncbi:MAG: ribonuclease P protein component [Bacteroidales bacterium]|nr:ribonuclease P protein component [Bacteroidales bacterium]